MKDFFKLFNPEQPPTVDEYGVARHLLSKLVISGDSFKSRIVFDFGPDIANEASQAVQSASNAPQPARRAPEQVKVVGLMSQQEQAEAYERMQHRESAMKAVEDAHQSMFVPKYGGQPIQRSGGHVQGQGADSHEYGLEA